MTPDEKKQFPGSVLDPETKPEDRRRHAKRGQGNDWTKIAKWMESAAFDRRAFLKYSGLLAGIAVVSNNCAGGGIGLSNVKETGPVHYPKLPGHKIQSLEHYGLEGCMVGYFNERTHGTSRPSLSEKTNRMEMGEIIDHYESLVGKTPSVLFMGYMWSRLSEAGNEFPIGQASAAAERGIIPFITYDLRQPFFGHGMEFSLSDIIKGKADHLLKDFARQSRKFGEEYGGFFIRTMREMNGHWYPWGQSWNMKPAWRYIYRIFNEEGANEYATWVWNPIVNEGRISYASNANQYYPGDEFVDWIGLNGFNFGPVSGNHLWNSFGETYALGYSIMRKKHPKKPILIAEVGCYPDKKQEPVWFRKMFYDLKEKFGGIKAICYFDMNWSNHPDGFDSRIDSSPEALKAFKEGITDPYFLGKVPYRKPLKQNTRPDNS